MLRVISKKIIARTGYPLINNFIRPENEEYKKKYDSGEPKKNILTEWLGMGRGMDDGATGTGINTNKPNEGTTTSYNKNERADDEPKPGNGSEISMGEGDQPGNPYDAIDTNNELFMQRRIQNDGKRDSRSSHLRDILDGKPVVLPHSRYEVKRK